MAETPIATDTAPAPLPSPRRGPILSKRQKAAILIRLLLKEGATLDLDDLPDSLQTELTHEMGALRSVDRATLESIMREFLTDLDNVGVTFGGGLESALDLLSGSISEEKLRRLRRETGLTVHGDPWKMLAGLNARDLAALIEKESAETAAVVLSKLPVAQSAEVLARLAPEQAQGVTHAVSTTGAVDPETVRTIGHALAAQIAEESPRAFAAAPVERIGAILNNSTTETRDGLLDGLSAQDAEFSAEIRKEIFTFANIADRVVPRDIAKITRAVDQAVLVTALAGCSEDGENRAAEFILGNMSKRMAAQLRQDVEDRGTVRPADADAAMADLVGVIRDMEEAGEIDMIQPDD